MTRDELCRARPEALVRFAWWLGIRPEHAITKDWLVNEVMLTLCFRHQNQQPDGR